MSANFIPRFSYGGPNEEAKSIRQKVFVEEQGYHDEFDSKDATAWHLVLFYKGLAVATGRILEEDPETYHLGRVAVLKEFRGHEIGRYLVKFLETKVREMGGRKCVLAAQADKQGFYAKCGYIPYGDGEIFYDEGHPHVLMYHVLEKPKRWTKRN